MNLHGDGRAMGMPAGRWAAQRHDAWRPMRVAPRIAPTHLLAPEHALPHLARVALAANGLQELQLVGTHHHALGIGNAPALEQLQQGQVGRLHGILQGVVPASPRGSTHASARRRVAARLSYARNEQASPGQQRHISAQVLPAIGAAVLRPQPVCQAFLAERVPAFQHEWLPVGGIVRRGADATLKARLHSAPACTMRCPKLRIAWLTVLCGSLRPSARPSRGLRLQLWCVKGPVDCKG